MKVLVIGANNSGKGTLVKLLEEKTGLETIGCSSVLKRYGKDITTGKLLPDKSVITIMDDFLSDRKDDSYILDGFPRTLGQYTYMKSYLFVPDLVVVLNISEEEVLQRAIGRRICEKCGDSYNLNGYKLPKEEGKCDLCGAKLYQREDDKEEVVKARYNEYMKETYPIVSKCVYDKEVTMYNIIVWEFDTTQSTEEIADAVADYINYMLN